MNLLVQLLLGQEMQGPATNPWNRYQCAAHLPFGAGSSMCMKMLKPATLSVSCALDSVDAQLHVCRKFFFASALLSSWLSCT